MEKSVEFKRIRKYTEVIEELKKGNYHYLWQPEYLEDLAEGPRGFACQGVPASLVSDFIMKEYDMVLDQEKCSGCGTCWVYCPLGVIYLDENSNFKIDEEYCRSCGICIEECPQNAINMTKIMR